MHRVGRRQRAHGRQRAFELGNERGAELRVFLVSGGRSGDLGPRPGVKLELHRLRGRRAEGSAARARRMRPTVASASARTLSHVTVFASPDSI